MMDSADKGKYLCMCRPRAWDDKDRNGMSGQDGS